LGSGLLGAGAHNKQMHFKADGNPAALKPRPTDSPKGMIGRGGGNPPCITTHKKKLPWASVAFKKRYARHFFLCGGRFNRLCCGTQHESQWRISKGQGKLQIDPKARRAVIRELRRAVIREPEELK